MRMRKWPLSPNIVAELIADRLLTGSGVAPRDPGQFLITHKLQPWMLGPPLAFFVVSNAIHFLARIVQYSPRRMRSCSILTQPFCKLLVTHCTSTNVTIIQIITISHHAVSTSNICASSWKSVNMLYYLQ